jgi:ribosomal protein S18 acetylase RimI-like enzyme
VTAHPLDDPAGSALRGADARFAECVDGAARYRPEISVISAGSWSGIAQLVGPGGVAAVAAATEPLPAGWTEIGRGDGLQLTGEHFAPAEDDDVVPLGAEHADAMADLVARLQPGPWAPETWRLGGYRGILVDGRLVAMAGERMHPDGHAEISAVCTEPEFRGRGFATRIMRAVAAGIVARGEVPFLHVSQEKPATVALYEHLGFRVRRPIEFLVAAAPTLEA